MAADDTVTMPVLFRRRPVWVLLALATAIAVTYVWLTFDHGFLAGNGRFWQNPVGPWLNDSADRRPNVDILGSLGGYYAYVQAPWRFPLFLIPSLGPPPGTSGVFLDIIPIVALAGKLVSIASGTMVNPYGAWVVLAFVLSAVFATLVLAEAEEAHLLGCVVASLLAISAPILLHRFGHLVMFGQFIVLAALWLYLRDRKNSAWRTVSVRWSVMLCLASLVGVYLFVMAGLIYMASWVERRLLEPADRRSRWGEPGLIALAVGVVLVIAGHVGQGTAPPFASGYGYWSMNLAAPFWPQRSGLLAGFWPIIDGTGGQYEGFAYLGAGGLALILLVLVIDRHRLVAIARAHPGFTAMAIGCTVFAVSDRVYLFNTLLLDYRIAWRIDYVLGTFRSSGRFFWPVYYALLLGCAVLVLRRSRTVVRVAIPLLVCVLQLADTEPLRARITQLSGSQVPMRIEHDAWFERVDRAAALAVTPSFNCTDSNGKPINAELSFLANRANRPTNTVYNPRAQTDCAAEAASALHGPWQDNTLYVFLSGVSGSLPQSFAPQPLQCSRFKYGIWCLGRATGN